MRRRNNPNAPKHVDMPPKSDAAADSQHPKTPLTPGSRRVPLLKRAISTGNRTFNPEVDVDEQGNIHVDAKGTPWEELDLSDSFLNALSESVERRPPRWYKRRRLVFILGGLLGIAMGWLFTEDPMSSLSNLGLDDRFGGWDIMSDLPQLSKSLNISELFAPGREWLTRRSMNFQVGREAAARGQTKKHAVIIVPGIISSGLESWATTESASSWFRKRIWAGTTMLRAIISDKDNWVRTLSLDPETGLDADGFKVRSAQGLEGATNFLPGYWIWGMVIENLAAIDYDMNDLYMFAYDWRLSFFNLEVRDLYFSRLKAQIEFNKNVLKKKTVLTSHSMGSLVTLWFFKWVESPGAGNGGPNWVEEHISDWINVAGTMLGVPKAMAALLSGEMRDTVEINAAAVYLLERYFSRNERVKLFRSWAGSSSMWLKGGDAVWGNGTFAPDDPEDAELSAGNIYYFKQEKFENTTDINSRTVQPNLTMSEATTYVLEHSPSAYQRMIAANYSFGFERDPAKLAENDAFENHQKWTNPLEVRLPNAPSMSIYCIYGVGKETERAYFYQQGGFEREEAGIMDGPQCTDAGCMNQTVREPLDFPTTRKSWIDTSVSFDASSKPAVRSGVIFNDGDGTVSALSLGAMCVEGWKRELYNPGKIRVVTHEIKHDPQAFDLRGGSTSGDHVDTLGSTELNEAILDVASGQGHRVKEQFFSDIRRSAARINWDG